MSVEIKISQPEDDLPWPYTGQKKATERAKQLYQGMVDNLKNGKPVKLLISKINSGSYFICKTQKQLDLWIDKKFEKDKKESNDWFKFIQESKEKGIMYADGLIFSITKPKLELAEKEPTNENKFDFIMCLNCFPDSGVKIEEPSEKELEYLSEYPEPKL